MQIKTLEALNKFIKDIHSKESYLDTLLLLNNLQLPSNLTHKVSYLLKERTLLIQIISAYQMELNVSFSEDCIEGKEDTGEL